MPSGKHEQMDGESSVVKRGWVGLIEFSIKYYNNLENKGTKEVINWCVMKRIISGKYFYFKCGDEMKLCERANDWWEETIHETEWTIVPTLSQKGVLKVSVFGLIYPVFWNFGLNFSVFRKLLSPLL